MKHLTLILAFMLSLSVFAAETYENVLVYKVIKVYDGDTITVDISGYPDIVGKKIGVRVNGIDTPEMTDKNDEIRRFAILVKAYVAAKLSVAKRIELRNIQRGKYFRIVADVYFDGVSLGELLVKKGFAKPYDGGTKNPWTVEDVRKLTKGGAKNGTQ